MNKLQKNRILKQSFLISTNSIFAIFFSPLCFRHRSPLYNTRIECITIPRNAASSLIPKQNSGIIHIPQSNFVPNPFLKIRYFQNRKILSMGDRNSASRNTDGSATATKLASIAMVLAVIFFFLLVILILFLYVYTHNYRIGRSRTRRRAHFVVAANDASIPRHGLNPSILLSLPISIYHSNDVKERLECAVCLCELNDGEKARLLPNCNHGFHLECIDMWFHSHSTCPLCRCPVGGEDGLHLSESATLDIVRSGLQEERMLVISTPDRSTGMFQLSLSPLTSSTSQVEEITSPFEVGRSPARLNGESLKRSLSREKMIGGSCCHSPEVSDIELGLVEYGEVNGEGSSAFPKP